MMTYPDTSFLVSLYLNDANGASAIRYTEESGGPLVFAPLTRIEMANAFRLWKFRGLLTAANVRAVLRDVSEDIASGFLEETPIAWVDLLAEAEQISARYTPKTGNRTLDILHVAAATVMGATCFLTFDARQHALAKRVGLTLPLPMNMP